MLESLSLEERIAIQEVMTQKPDMICEELLQSYLWEKQREIIRSVFTRQRTTVKSCNGSGKTFIAARSAISYLIAHMDSIVFTTAPTRLQVYNNMWREIRGAYENALVPLGGEVLKAQLEFGTNWYAYGNATNNPENLRGIHAKSGKTLIIVDEAGGTPPENLEALEGNLTSRDVSLLYIGNPTRAYGSFFDSFKSPLFHKISISVFDTPNFTINGIFSLDILRAMTLEQIMSLPIPFPALVSPEWAWGKLMQWGENSPMFKAMVLGEFPEESEDTLFPLHILHSALDETVEREDWGLPRIAIGVDVARYGTDSTVITVMENNKHLVSIEHHGKDTMKVVGEVIKTYKEYRGAELKGIIAVDDIGVGGGVSDRLIEQGFHVVRINNADGSSDEQFLNFRAESYWYLRQLLLENKLLLKDTGKLIAHLSQIRYHITSSGKIQIMSKENMKKEGMDSPDYADSMVMAVWAMKMGKVQYVKNIFQQQRTIAGNLTKKTF